MEKLTSGAVPERVVEGAKAAIGNICTLLKLGSNKKEVPSNLQKNTVYLNVYDTTVANHILYYTGTGVHHSGVEVYGKEFSFGRCDKGTGVSETIPRHSEPHVFREQLVLGVTKLTLDEVMKLVQEIQAGQEWSGSSYHLVKRNCNHFAESFAKLLLPPDVRNQQHAKRGEEDKRDGFVEAFDCGEREVEKLSDGRSVSLPVLMPSWVNRLARTATGLLTADMVEQLDQLDKKL
ncbi:PPPDE putative peptidase domain [Trypanosoma vivax]|nr:hypothetical protein TRVL_00465 [Trypanosoma vivax]KAH8605151.1 PPPDE putative peptidase domain [Trypanosoma vivax]